LTPRSGLTAHRLSLRPLTDLGQRAPMARPRIDTNARRSRQVSIRLTPAEARAIEAAVARAGRPPVAFIRSAALAAAGAASRLREPARTEATAIRQELRRIGANLNQALRLAHAGRDADLAAAVTAVRDVVARRLA